MTPGRIERVVVGWTIQTPDGQSARLSIWPRCGGTAAVIAYRI